jgi:hypothetical protein
VSLDNPTPPADGIGKHHLITSTENRSEGAIVCSVSSPLNVLRRSPEWTVATENLRNLLAEQGNYARRRAESYGRCYQGRRGSMVIDVVTSRRRRYQQRVLPLVRQWEADSEEYTLHWLAEHEPSPDLYGLRSGEARTITTVARNLADFADGTSLDEDQACRRWADEAAGLEHAPSLDPVIGVVPGIGPALFAYLRMRSGANAIKPDRRVATALCQLGFCWPKDEHATLVLAHAAADEAGIELLVLDQLLWWLESPN